MVWGAAKYNYTLIRCGKELPKICLSIFASFNYFVRTNIITILYKILNFNK